MAQAVQDPIAYLQSQAKDIPIIRTALELGERYNGDYDAATKAILEKCQIDEQQVRDCFNQLGIK